MLGLYDFTEKLVVSSAFLDESGEVYSASGAVWIDAEPEKIPIPDPFFLSSFITAFRFVLILAALAPGGSPFSESLVCRFL